MFGGCLSDFEERRGNAGDISRKFEENSRSLSEFGAIFPGSSEDISGTSGESEDVRWKSMDSGKFGGNPKEIPGIREIRGKSEGNPGENPGGIRGTFV